MTDAKKKKRLYQGRAWEKGNFSFSTHAFLSLMRALMGIHKRDLFSSANYSG